MYNFKNIEIVYIKILNVHSVYLSTIKNIGKLNYLTKIVLRYHIKLSYI